MWGRGGWLGNGLCGGGRVRDGVEVWGCGLWGAKVEPITY